MHEAQTDPVLREMPVPVFGMASVWQSRGNTALVFADAQDSACTGEPPRLRRRLAGRVRMYEVDTSLRSVTIIFDLPSADEALYFSARMHLQWRVAKPEAVIRAGLRDAQSVFWPFFQRQLRPIARRFRLEDNAGLEADLNRYLDEAPFSLDHGIEVASCFVSTSVADDDAKAFLLDRAKVRWGLEQQEAEHRLAMLREEYRARESELQRAAARLTEEHDLLLKKQRMSFYQSALEDRSLGVLILQLIEHPADISAVVKLLQGRKQSYLQAARDTLRDMIRNDELSLADLDPVRQRAVDHLHEALESLATDARTQKLMEDLGVEPDGDGPNLRSVS